MSKKKRNKQQSKQPPTPANDRDIGSLDATPERLQRAIEEAGSAKLAWDEVNPAKIDSKNEIVLVRRFRSAHLDRLYRKDDDRSPLTWRQWYAGDRYREVHSASGFGRSVIAAYGERVSSGEPNYGMPRTQAQAEARDLWRRMRQQFPIAMVGFMDRLLLHDDLPRAGGGKQARLLVKEIGFALDCLADFLKLNAEPIKK